MEKNDSELSDKEKSVLFHVINSAIIHQVPKVEDIVFLKSVKSKLMDMFNVLDPLERAKEKQKSRDEDAQALKDGTKTVEDLKKQNHMFNFKDMNVKVELKAIK